MVCVDFLPIGGVVQGQPTVGNPGGLGDVLRALRPDKYGQVRAQGMGDGLDRLAHAPGAGTIVGQGVELAVTGNRFLAGQHLAHDINVFAGSRQWFGIGLAVPTLYHLGSGYAQAQYHSAA